MEASFDAGQVDEILTFVESAQHDVLLKDGAEGPRLVVRKNFEERIRRQVVCDFCSRSVEKITATPLPVVDPTKEKLGAHLPK